MDKLAKLRMAVIAFVQAQPRAMLIALAPMQSKAIGAKTQTRPTIFLVANGSAEETSP